MACSGSSKEAVGLPQREPGEQWLRQPRRREEKVPGRVCGLRRRLGLLSAGISKGFAKDMSLELDLTKSEEC